MNLLSAEALGKAFGDRPLFKNLALGISKGEKVALVGNNGSGKSTLMKIMAGQLPPDEGLVSVRKQIRVGYLPQQPLLDPQMTIEEAIFSLEIPALQALRQYEQALEQPEDSSALEKAMIAMEEYQAWDLEVQIKQILGKLGIHDLQKPIAQLSGGQKKRVALAQLLIEAPDLLLLDEPTNHLDLESIEWLEHFLSQSQQSLLLVSHDRYFLDAVCNKIIELQYGHLYHYEGKYAYFLEKKAEREQIAQAEISKAKNLLRKELEWMRRQPKARGTKAKYRVEQFHQLQDKASQQQKDAQVQLEVQSKRLGGKIVEVEGMTKRYGELPIVNHFDYIFKKGDRIGIVGKNGVGKSTFLKMLTGQESPDAGRIAAGETLQFGYYTQEDLHFAPESRVIDLVKEIAEVITLANGDTITASQFLNHFLFPPEVQYKPVEKLSGGEKRRLQLMRVLMRNPNFLILDEPTNDLDLETLNVLEEFLQNFKGCLLLVSHDRYFMDKLVEQLFVFEGAGEVRIFNGNYSDYRDFLEEQEQIKKQEVLPREKAKATTPVNQVENTSKKLSFKEKQEFEQLGKEIAQLEAQKKALSEQLNQGHEDHTKLQAWALEVETIVAALSQKEMRWLELSELM